MRQNAVVVAGELSLEGCGTWGLAFRALFKGSIVPPIILSNVDLFAGSRPEAVPKGGSMFGAGPFLPDPGTLHARLLPLHQQMLGASHGERMRGSGFGIREGQVARAGKAWEVIGDLTGKTDAPRLNGLSDEALKIKRAVQRETCVSDPVRNRSLLKRHKPVNLK